MKENKQEKLNKEHAVGLGSGMKMSVNLVGVFRNEINKCK